MKKKVRWTFYNFHHQRIASESPIIQYYYSKKIQSKFDDARNSIIEALKEEGFGILTEIDVKKALKEKLDVDFRPYRRLEQGDHRP